MTDRHTSTRGLRGLASRLPTPRWRTVAVLVAAVNVQVLFVLVYASIFDRSPLDPWLYYPFVWMNVGVWAVLRTEPPAASRYRRRLAGAVAVVYFLALLFASGGIAPGPALGGAGFADGFAARVFSLPPGHAPTLLYNGAYLHLSLRPPFVVGFLALAYQVYAAVLDASGAVGAGALALFSCVTCTLPLVAAGVGLLTGVSAAAIVQSLGPYLWQVGTLLYLAAVGLLYWRPDPLRAIRRRR